MIVLSVVIGLIIGWLTPASCGATNEQKDTYALQNSAYKDSLNNAQQVFGASSSVFNDLMKAFSPIVANGPNQTGFSLPELSALKSQAITDTGKSYEHARQVVQAGQAAQGGTGVAGYEGALNAALAREGAESTAGRLTDINLKNYETGRNNFFQAAGVLGGAPGVFSPSTGATEASIGAGNASANEANAIAASNNSWMNVVGGVLGGVAGGLVSPGGLLGKIGSSAGSAATSAVQAPFDSSKPWIANG